MSSYKEAFSKPPFFISYFISEPSIFNSINKIFTKFSPDIVCFRDKKTENLEPLVKSFIQKARKSNIKLALINTHINLAIKYNYDGVHLTSKQFDDIKTAKKNKLFVIISCHNEDEVILAKNYGADAATYSPIFDTPNKGKPKGIKELKYIVNKYQDKNFNIIALGGIIDDNHIEQIKQTQAKGFASIRYFGIV